MIDVTGVCPPARHEAIKLDERAWAALAFIAIQAIDFGDGETERLEYRNCACGSTLCRSVAP
jgi:hypothetical protein